MLMLAATAALIALYLDFVIRTRSSANSQVPEVAVVFTGDFARITAALPLVADGRVRHLFISGANIDAGIRPEAFAEQFRLGGDLRAALDAGRIAFGAWADNTFQNAMETACWVHRHHDAAPILLITSAAHMPRASVALERSLPDRTILRMSVASAAYPAKLPVEFLKYVATRMMAMAGLAGRGCPGQSSSTAHFIQSIGETRGR